MLTRAAFAFFHNRFYAGAGFAPAAHPFCFSLSCLGTERSCATRCATTCGFSFGDCLSAKMSSSCCCCCCSSAKCCDSSCTEQAVGGMISKHNIGALTHIPVSAGCGKGQQNSTLMMAIARISLRVFQASSMHPWSLGVLQLLKHVLQMPRTEPVEIVLLSEHRSQQARPVCVQSQASGALPGGTDLARARSKVETHG